MGDLNEGTDVIRMLREHSLRDSFAACGLFQQLTHPALPTGHGLAPQVLDWQFHRGPLRVMTSAVVNYFLDGTAPSDHKPLVATYGLTGREASPE